MFLRVGCLMMFCSTAAFASVYMQKDANGNISYSDVGGAGWTAINIPDASSTTTVTTQTPTGPSAKSKDKMQDVLLTYKRLEITSPKEQENVQNQALVPVAIAVDPSLRDGDRIQLFVDGKPWGEAVASTQMAIQLEQRGQHTVSAVILDKNQRVLQQSSTVTFFVHRNSVITSPAH